MRTGPTGIAHQRLDSKNFMRNVKNFSLAYFKSKWTSERK